MGRLLDNTWVTPPAPSSKRWLFGPVSDLVLGCGLGYAAIFVLLSLAGDGVRSVVPYGLAPLLALVTGGPHYGATLLRVYERREDRRAYVFFAVWATLLVWLAFGVGLYSVVFGSFLLTLYLTWSPWHYTGQNYGIALIFLRRRGVEVTARTKRFIYASFFCSFLLTVLAIHGPAASADYTPVGFYGTRYALLRLPIPGAAQVLLFVSALLGYLAASVAAAVSLLRVARLRDLAPTALLVGTQALWFAVPVLARQLDVLQGVEPLSTEYAAYAFLWVAAGHAVQYLWVTSFYASASSRFDGYLRYLGRCFLAGAAIWVVPALLFAPGLLGRVPYDAGLAVLIAAVVNLHHFILDGAIWKLRDGRVARILVRAREETIEAPSNRVSRGGPVRRLVWAVGLVCVAIIVAGTLEEEFGFRQAIARGDVARVERAAERLAWLGRDSPVVRANAGALAADLGDLERGRRNVAASLALYPTADAWRIEGWMHEQAGDAAKAMAAYQNALDLRPDSVEAMNNLAWLRATHENALLRDARRAIELAEAAAEATGYRSPEVLDTLAAAHAAAWRFPNAIRAAESAITLAEARGAEGSSLESMRARLHGYRQGQPFVSSAAAMSEAARARTVRWRVYAADGETVNPLYRPD